MSINNRREQLQRKQRAWLGVLLVTLLFVTPAILTLIYPGFAYAEEMESESIEGLDGLAKESGVLKIFINPLENILLWSADWITSVFNTVVGVDLTSLMIGDAEVIDGMGIVGNNGNDLLSPARNLNYFAFSLSKGNIYGLSAAIVYRYLRSMAFAMLALQFTYYIFRMIIGVASGDQMRRLKQDISNVIMCIILLVLMPFVLNIALKLRAEAVASIYTPLYGSNSYSGHFIYALTKSIISSGINGWMIPIAFVLLIAFLVIHFKYMVDYIKLALTTTIGFMTFPFVCMIGSGSVKNRLGSWFSIMLGNFCMPIIDCALLFVPLIALYMYGDATLTETAGAFLLNSMTGAVGSLFTLKLTNLLVVVIIFSSARKLRRLVPGWLGLADNGLTSPVASLARVAQEGVKTGGKIFLGAATGGASSAAGAVAEGVKGAAAAGNHAGSMRGIVRNAASRTMEGGKTVPVSGIGGADPSDSENMAKKPSPMNAANSMHDAFRGSRGSVGEGNTASSANPRSYLEKAGDGFRYAKNIGSKLMYPSLHPYKHRRMVNQWKADAIGSVLEQSGRAEPKTEVGKTMQAAGQKLGKVMQKQYQARANLLFGSKPQQYTPSEETMQTRDDYMGMVQQEMDLTDRDEELGEQIKTMQEEQGKQDIVSKKGKRALLLQNKMGNKPRRQTFDNPTQNEDLKEFEGLDESGITKKQGDYRKQESTIQQQIEQNEKKKSKTAMDLTEAKSKKAALEKKKTKTPKERTLLTNLETKISDLDEDLTKMENDGRSLAQEKSEVQKKIRLADEVTDYMQRANSKDVFYADRFKEELGNEDYSMFEGKDINEIEDMVNSAEVSSKETSQKVTAAKNEQTEARNQKRVVSDQRRIIDNMRGRSFIADARVAGNMAMQFDAMEDEQAQIQMQASERLKKYTAVGTVIGSAVGLGDGTSGIVTGASIGANIGETAANIKAFNQMSMAKSGYIRAGEFQTHQHLNKQEEQANGDYTSLFPASFSSAFTSTKAQAAVQNMQRNLQKNMETGTSTSEVQQEAKNIQAFLGSQMDKRYAFNISPDGTFSGEFRDPSVPEVPAGSAFSANSTYFSTSSGSFKQIMSSMLEYEKQMANYESGDVEAKTKHMAAEEACKNIKSSWLTQHAEGDILAMVNSKEYRDYEPCETLYKASVMIDKATHDSRSVDPPRMFYRRDAVSNRLPYANQLQAMSEIEIGKLGSNVHSADWSSYSESGVPDSAHQIHADLQVIVARIGAGHRISTREDGGYFCDTTKYPNAKIMMKELARSSSSAYADQLLAPEGLNLTIPENTPPERRAEIIGHYIDSMKL